MEFGWVADIPKLFQSTSLCFFSQLFFSCLFESSGMQKSSCYANKGFILIIDFWMALNNVLSQFRLVILHSNVYFDPSSSAEIMLMTAELHLPGDWLFAPQRFCSLLSFWYTGNFLLPSPKVILCALLKYCKLMMSYSPQSDQAVWKVCWVSK